MDDLTVVANSPEQMLRRLTWTLEKLKIGGLKLKPSKCEFLVNETTILNFKVSYGKIYKNAMKSALIDQKAVPTNKKEVQAFMGFMNYFRPYILNFADIAAPLYELTGNKDFKWTPECQKAFDNLKIEVKRNIYLSFPDPNKPFFMECDASQYGIGAILYQEDDNREHHKVKDKMAREELLKEELQKDYSKPPKATR
jgi:hypothetical protein